MSDADDPRPAEAVPLDERSRRIVDGLADGYVSFDADWRLTDGNDATERLFSRPREDLLGCRLCDITGLTDDSPFAALAKRVAETRTPEDAELSWRSHGGSRLLSVRAFPLDDGVGAVWRDITAARAAERRLALREARYREIADGVPAAAWLSNENGKIEFINQAMVDALGRPRRDLLGQGWMRCIDPADRPGLLAARSRARATHGSFYYEGRFRRPDGALRIIEMYGRPRFDAQGAFRGHVGIAADVTEAREHAEQQQLLIQELNHRVKNTLATVQSLVRLTIRDHGAPSTLERDITERLLGLAAAHDVLSRENWEGAELTAIIAEVLQSYAGRIATTGPKARLSPKTALALSMGLQELATNAAKYGALTTADGRVQLTWTKNNSVVDMEWRESGGPHVIAPEPTGFGSALLGRVLPRELGHTVEVTHAPDGLICRLGASALD